MSTAVQETFLCIATANKRVPTVSVLLLLLLLLLVLQQQLVVMKLQS